MIAVKSVFGAATVGPLVVQHVTCDFSELAVMFEMTRSLHSIKKLSITIFILGVNFRFLQDT
jgi:hypothetical protein